MADTNLNQKQLDFLDTLGPKVEEEVETEEENSNDLFSQENMDFLQQIKNRAAQDANPSYMVNPFEDITMETTIEEVKAKYPGNIPLQQIVASDAYINATTEEEKQNLIEEGINAFNDQVYSGTGSAESGFNVRRLTGGRYVTVVDQPKLEKIKNSEKYKTAVANNDQDKINQLEANANVKYAVNRPGGDGSLNPFAASSLDDNQERGFVGATLDFVEGSAKKAIKEGAEFGEGLLEMYGFNDPDTDYVSQNMAILAPQSKYEDLVTDIGSIVIGGATGAGLVTKLTKIPGITGPVANGFSKSWDKIRKTAKNPEELYNASKKWEAGIRAYLAMRGGNMGAAIATPDQVKALFGDEVLESFGVDPENNQTLSHFIDNELFSVGLKTLGIIGSRTIGSKGLDLPKKAGGFLRGFKAPSDKEAAFIVMKSINQGLDDAPLEEVAYHMSILSRVIANNENFAITMLGGAEKQVGLDTAMAVSQGAKEYVEQAYAHFKKLMPEDEFQAFILGKQEEIVQGINGVKSGFLNNPAVKSGSTNINQSVDNIISETADDIAIGTKVSDDITGEAQKVADNVTESAAAKEMADLGLDAVGIEAKAVQDQNKIINMLNEAVENNSLGTSVAEKTALNELSGEVLYKGWKDSYTNYNKLFQAIPEGVSFDVGDFISTVNKNFKTIDDLDIVTQTATKADPVADMLKAFKPQAVLDDAGEVVMKDGKAVMETAEEVIERISKGDIDLKRLYTEIRPALSGSITTLKNAGNPAYKKLINIKTYIDDLAEQSGDDSFNAAMTAYKNHEGIYGNTVQLNTWEQSAKQVVDTVEPSIVPGFKDTTLISVDNIPAGALKVPTAMGTPKGWANMVETGAKMQNSSFESLTPEIVKSWIKAVGQGSVEEVSPQYVKHLVGLAINAIGKTTQAGDSVGSQNIINAIQDYVVVLEKMGTKESQDAVNLFRTTVDDLKSVEAGVITANDLVANTTTDSLKLLKDAKSETLSKFINNITTSPEVLQPAEITKRLTKMFNSDTAITDIRSLMSRIDETGDPILKEALQAQYLRHLRDKIFTNKGIDLQVNTQGNVSRVNEASPASLNKMLSQDDMSFSILDELFKKGTDDEIIGTGIKNIIVLQNLAINPQAVRPLTMGSSTISEAEMMKGVNQLITWTLGILNPTATKARSIASGVVSDASSKNAAAAEALLVSFLVNPAFARNALDQAVNNSAKFDKKSFLEMLTTYNMRGVFTEYKDTGSEAEQMDAIMNIKANQAMPGVSGGPVQ